MVNVPSPALAVVGRHNSGKTTLIEKLIAELVSRGHDVGSVKHHSHPGFEIDYPGKDSYRHRAAGATETVIASPGLIARIKSIEGEEECSSIVKGMPGHDIVIVEGYRKSGLPTIEVMRADNEADRAVAAAFAQGAREGWGLGTDFTQVSRPKDGARAEHAGKERTSEESAGEESVSSVEHLAVGAAADAAVARGLDAHAADLAHKMPTGNTVAIVTDISEAVEAAGIYGIPAFGLEDISAIASFVESGYVREHVTVVIQAGGESRRMGRSKATVPFGGRPLICRLVERLSPAADELVITTNEPDNLAFLHDMYPELGIRLVRDAFDYRGALPGLYTALSAASNPCVAVVACDMVFASAALVVAEAEAMRESGASVVVPVNKHGYEPFHAIYRKDACLPSITRALDRGEKRAQGFFGDNIIIREFTQDEVLAAEPMGGCFINANTPDELKALEEAYLD